MSACAIVRSRLFVFGGDVGDSGTSSTKPSNGVYSIDLDRTLATGNPTDLQSHGVLDTSLAGTLNQVALVQSGPRVLLAGGSGRRTDASNAPLDAMYLYDVAKGTTSTQAAKIQVALNASVQAAAAISEGMSDLYFFGGVKDATASTPLNWLAVVRSDGTVGNSNVTAGPDPRQLATLGRFNRTHNLMTGGVGVNDQWLLELKSLAWTRVPATMARGRVHHRTIIYRSRYLIHVGGASTPRSYELVEYTDIKAAGSAQIGKIVNPSSGPTSLAYGCAHLEDDVIVYVGGWVFESDGQMVSTGALASFLNLLQILPQTDGTLQFKWVTGHVDALNG
ncbi:hypothetical protein GGF32_001695 [Allomyces javanicus]|nr:hypothetical protein GGF32_001695 [Allomyces javanicus]